MATNMAILQEVDKCIRCNGCVISCKRTWHMKGDNEASPDLPHNKLAANQRVVIKSQARADSGPFVRYSCWHCENPPCASNCPFKAIKKNPVSGAVWIDPNLCDPTDSRCAHQCKTDCQKGGIPMIGSGCDLYRTEKAWKCTLCTGVDQNGVQFGPYKGAGEFGDLPTKATAAEIDAVADKAHQPTCVFTCPAKAMSYDTKVNIRAQLAEGGYVGVCGDASGQMFWASKKGLVAPPKADPFMEDHIAPMVSGLLSSPFAKAALAPTLVVGALLAMSARRAKIEEEALSVSGEVR